MFYIGIDIAKSKHQASIIDASGSILCDSLSFPNTSDGCDKLIAQLVKLNISKEDALLGMEATGHYWLALYTYLTDLGFTIKVINPIQSDAYRRLLIRTAKTDPIDAYIIAELIRQNLYRSSSFAEEDMFALRQLSRYRMSLVDNCSDIKRKVIALLDQVFPEYSSLFSDTFGVASKDLLLKYPTPEDILKISTAKLTALLKKSSKGRLGSEKAKHLKNSASTTFGIKFAKDAFSFQIKQLIEQIKFIENQIYSLEEEIDSLMRELNSPITTICGIGPTLGAIILSELGDINRFSDPSKIVAYAGLDASVKQSGDFTGTKTRISKRGSPYLRRAIWAAATIASFHDPVLTAYYQKKRSQGKSHGTAIGAVSRKLINIIYAVLKSNEPYSPRP